jgi:hypothetical protein
MSDRFSTTPGQSSLAGATISSELQPGVSYRLERQIGVAGVDEPKRVCGHPASLERGNLVEGLERPGRP